MVNRTMYGDKKCGQPVFGVMMTAICDYIRNLLFALLDYLAKD